MTRSHLPAVFLLTLTGFLVNFTAAEEGWFSFKPAGDDFAPTAIDLSRFVEAPAGKHGFLKSQGEAFVFADGTPIRFWGVHINPWFGKFKGAKEERNRQIDQQVRWLKMMGVNLVRRMPMGEIGGRDGVYNDEGWDALDYFIHACGQAGIYVKLCPDYGWAFNSEAEAKPYAGRFTAAQLVQLNHPNGHFVCEELVQFKWKRFKDVFTHTNPYNNKRYCDDPAIAMISLQNECSWFFYQNFTGEPFRTLSVASFKTWLKARYATTDKLRAAWTVDGSCALAAGESLDDAANLELYGTHAFAEGSAIAKKGAAYRRRAEDQMRWMTDAEERYWTRTAEYLRQIGVQQPICGSPWRGAGFTTRMHLRANAPLDFVDRHGYYGGSEPFGENGNRHMIAKSASPNVSLLKSLGKDLAAVNSDDAGNLVLGFAWERVIGRPVIQSEWNSHAINEWSLEVVPAVIAYGSLQGWNAPIQFFVSSPTWSNAIGPHHTQHDMTANPPWMLQYPLFLLAWHRRDIREAPYVAEKLYSDADLCAFAGDRTGGDALAALVGKVGINFTGKSAVQGELDPALFIDRPNRTVRSLTKELTWDGGRGLLLIDTPRTAAVVGFFGDQTHRLNACTFAPKTSFGSLAITTLDDVRTLGDSPHLLIQAVGRAKNTGMERASVGAGGKANIERFAIKPFGTAPLLLEAITGSVTLHNAHAAKLKCWALHLNGKRKAEVRTEVCDGAITIPLSAADEAVYYELAEK